MGEGNLITWFSFGCCYERIRACIFPKVL